MKIIISPAKKMNVDLHGLAPEGLPCFLTETETILTQLQGMTLEELQSLWKCNDGLAQLNWERLSGMDLRHSLTPALLAYEGIQFQNMAPNVFEDADFSYVCQHLRILSGFYGLLRPLDGVTPYRLEMQGKLALSGHKNLYQFWGDKLASALVEQGDWVLNLASNEYSKGVLPYLSAENPVVTCKFGQIQGDKVVERGTLCKMARGQMVRWLAQHNITQQEQVKEFSELDFQFQAERSTPQVFVFVQGNSKEKS